MLNELFESVATANSRFDETNDKIDMYVESVISNMSTKLYEAESEMLFNEASAVLANASEKAAAAADKAKTAAKDAVADVKKMQDAVSEARDAIKEAAAAVREVKGAKKNPAKLKTAAKTAEDKMKAADDAYSKLLNIASNKNIAVTSQVMGSIVGTMGTSVIYFIKTFSSFVTTNVAAGTILAKLDGEKNAFRKSLGRNTSKFSLTNNAQAAALVTTLGQAITIIMNIIRDVKKGNVTPATFNTALNDIYKQYKSVSAQFSKVVVPTLVEINKGEVEEEMKTTEESVVTGTVTESCDEYYEAGYSLSDEDFDKLMVMKEEAETGILASIAKAIDKIIETFKKFYQEMKIKVLSKVVKEDFKQQVDKVEKKVKLNPFFARKKVKIDNTEKQSGVIAWFQGELQKLMSKIKGGKEVTADELDDLDDEYKKRFNTVSTASAMVETTVSNAIASAKRAVAKIGDSLDSAYKFTNAQLKNAKDAAAGAASEVAGRLRRLASMASAAGKDMINVIVNAVLSVLSAIRQVASKVTGKVKEEEVNESVEMTSDEELDSIADEILKESAKDDVDSILSDIENDIFGESGLDLNIEME